MPFDLDVDNPKRDVIHVPGLLLHSVQNRLCGVFLLFEDLYTQLMLFYRHKFAVIF
jgi:hypothetical protein